MINHCHKIFMPTLTVGILVLSSWPRLDFTHSQLSGSCGRVSGFGANGSQVGGAIFVAAYIEPIYLILYVQETYA